MLDENSWIQLHKSNIIQKHHIIFNCVRLQSMFKDNANNILYYGEEAIVARPCLSFLTESKILVSMKLQHTQNCVLWFLLVPCYRLPKWSAKLQAISCIQHLIETCIASHPNQMHSIIVCTYFLHKLTLLNSFVTLQIKYFTIDKKHSSLTHAWTFWVRILVSIKQ